ncbi:short-chain fatty acid transporter [bacterium SCSIO 12741]|nr:short-chain fatty acid transporter [bacterium SCSIO 12741]
MSFSERFIRLFRSVLPAPFTIAVLLTVVTWFLAFSLGDYPQADSLWLRAWEVSSSWEAGIWTNGLMVFAVQMMLMLVLGHVLALTKPVDALIRKALVYCQTTASAAATVVLLTMMVGWFNWGLGLIFGAIFARKVAEQALEKGLSINYPLIGAAGYAGLMVWHGGLSGSSLTKVAEPGHLKSLMKGIYPPEQISVLPEQIDFSQTVFSPMNLVVTLLCFTVIPFVLFQVGKRAKPQPIDLKASPGSDHVVAEQLFGAERLDHSSWLGVGFGLILLGVVVLKATWFNEKGILAFFTPNNINLALLALGLLMHQKFSRFLQALEEAIGGVSGILIQFPLYFGIMGMMKESGLIHSFSEAIVAVSNDTTYPIFTFISAGIVNIFVPSGGGQWAIQGPIIVEAARNIDVPLSKSILAMAYGDQLTNMLQPFWALPLLGITGLKAKDILPYTLLLFLLGGLIFLIGLLLF